MAASAASTDGLSKRLTNDPRSWPGWFALLKSHCGLKECWEHINPDVPDSNLRLGSTPNVLSLEEWTEQHTKERDEKYQTRLRAWEKLSANRRSEDSEDETPEASETLEQMGLPEKPTKPPVLSDDDAMKYYDFYLKSSAIRGSGTNKKSKAVGEIWMWIQETVDASILKPNLIQLSGHGTQEQVFSVQQVVRNIRNDVAPNFHTSQNIAIKDYQAHLAKAKGRAMRARDWYRTWYELYLNGRAFGIPDVEGTIATENFLYAVGHHFAPMWSRAKIQEIMQNEVLGKDNLTLEQYGKVFASLLTHDQISTAAGHPGVFATFGLNEPSSNARQTRDSGGQPQQRRESHRCPCLRSRDATHRWRPTECDILKACCTGQSSEREGFRMPSDRTKHFVMWRLGAKHNETLVSELRNRGWIPNDWTRPGKPVTQNSPNPETQSKQAGTQFPGTIKG